MGINCNICCEKQNRYEKTSVVPTEDVDYLFYEKEKEKEEDEKEEEIEKEQKQLLSQPSRIPQHLKDLKISTKDLIQKRLQSPYEYYNVIKEIGRGSYGRVELVCLKRNRSVIRAMKIIDKKLVSKNISYGDVSTEIEILRRLDHPYITKMYEYFEDEFNFYFVYEYCPDGDFCKKAIKYGTFPEIFVRYFLLQLLQAVAYLHDNKVVHGDIKLENVLICNSRDNLSEDGKLKLRFSTLIKGNNLQDFQEKMKDMQNKEDFTSSPAFNFVKDFTKYKVKLIDFGCSKIFSNKKLSGVIGTTIYCSPEVINNSFNEKCDEWSLGVLAYILLYGEPPFTGENEEMVFNNILKNKVIFPDDYILLKGKSKSTSANCKDLIRKLLEKDPDKRISAKEALNHKFFFETIRLESFGSISEEDELDCLALLTKFENYKKKKKKNYKFQELVEAYIILNFIDKDQENQIRKVINNIDKSGEYKITKQEFQNYFNNSQIKKRDSELNELFETLDADRSGELEFQEMARVLSNMEILLTESNLREAFDFFDKDLNGSITCDEIYQTVFAGKEGKEKEKLLDDFLKEIHKSKTDEINFEEFCEIMKQEEN